MAAKSDRVIGIRPREKRDLILVCNEPGTPPFQPDVQAFMKVWCSRCKQGDCIRAKGRVASWEERMATQVDYLLNEPQFSDLATEEHQAFARMAFASLEAKARQLAIAAQRQDWAIPEVETSSPATPPPQFEPVSEVPVDDEVVYETDYPSTDRRRTYHVALRTTSGWSCECAAFRHRRACKHLKAVRSWYEQQSDAEQPVPVPVARVNTPPQRAPLVGAPPLAQPTIDFDPWAPRGDNFVEVGATVVVKGEVK